MESDWNTVKGDPAMVERNPLEWMRRPSSVLAVAVLGICLLASAAFAAGSSSPPLPTHEQVNAEIAALNEAYDSLPPLTDPEQLLERNNAYEEAFSNIGGEAPNGQPVKLTAADYVPNFPASGIQDLPETLPGYEPV